MIKNWKLFLESNSDDQEILDNIRDILISLKVFQVVNHIMNLNLFFIVMKKSILIIPILIISYILIIT